MDNPNDIFFDGNYKDIWRSMIPEELTKKEVEFLIAHFKLDSHSHVLDLMCGYGRHALGLARKGISVKAIDNLEEYTREIEIAGEHERLPLEVINANVANCSFTSNSTLAICMGNSLNFFPKETIQKILDKVFNSLQPGGHLVINMWSITEIVAKDFQWRNWTEIDGVKFLAQSEYKFAPTRVETATTMISSDLQFEQKLAIDYIFSIAEIDDMLGTAGFSALEYYSVPGRKRFAFGDSKLYVLAGKI